MIRTYAYLSSLHHLEGIVVAQRFLRSIQAATRASPRVMDEAASYTKRLRKLAQECSALSRSTPIDGARVDFFGYLSKYESLSRQLSTLEEQFLASGSLGRIAPCPKALGKRPNDQTQQPSLFVPNALRTRPDPELEKRLHDVLATNSRKVSRELALSFNEWVSREIESAEEFCEKISERSKIATSTHVR